MNLELPKETKDKLIESIKRFYHEKIDDDIGDLKALLILDYIMQEFAPIFYNQAIKDAQSYIYDKLNDLDAVCYLMEFGYWEKQDKKK